jgi:hypothetical protein
VEFRRFVAHRHQRLDLADLALTAGAIAGTVTSDPFDLRGVTQVRCMSRWTLTAAHLLIGLELQRQDGTWLASGYMFNVAGLTVAAPNNSINAMVSVEGVNRTQYWGGMDSGAPNSVALPATAGRLALINNGGTVVLDAFNVDLLWS